jgi:Lar family restriction alleviation protein
MNTPLKPCPFCGAAPKQPRKTGGGDERNGYNFRVHIACSGCGAEIIRDSHQDKQGWCDDKGQAQAAAIAAWNRRA